jgi:competence protein ComEC
MAIITVQLKDNAAGIVASVPHLDAIVATGQRGLWLLVFFGAGIGLYFALPVEPEFWPAALLLGLGGFLAVAMRRRRNGVFFAVVAGAAMAAGFGAAQLRSDAISGPVLDVKSPRTR